MALSGLFGTAIGQDAQGESGGEGGDPSRLPVKDKDLTAPPGSPSVGDRYIVASVASGVWAGHEDDIAEWAGAAWTFETPIIGWITYVEDETEYYSWNGVAWVMESAGPHATTHENGGADEVSVAGLSGVLADAQTPLAHAVSHKDGGTDEVSTAVAAANVIPKTGGAGKLAIGFMPDAVVGGVSYQGTWNAATNTPTLASGVGTKGHYYVVATPGSTNLDGITDWKANDWAIYNGTAWEKVKNTDQVSSVFGRTGAVAATSGDYTHAETSGQTADDHHAQQHALGGADHTAATLAELNAKISDATLVAAWDEAQIYYVGKHGNDSNDGKSIDEALLTIGAAITLAAAQTPSATNRFTIHVADAGVYTEDVTIPSYVSLDAPSAKIVGRVVLNDDASLVADTVAPPATGGSAGSCVSKTSGAGDAHVAVKTIVPSSTANRGVFCSSGAVFIQIDHINGASFGIGLYTSSAGKVYGRVGRIYNPAAGSTGILTLSTSGVFVSAGEIEAPFVCDAAAGTSIYLVGGRLVGTRTVAAGATVMITEAGIVPAEVVDYVGDGTNDREIDLDDDYYRVEIRARGNYSRTADHLGLAWCLGDDYGIDANDGAASNLRSYVGSNGYSRFQGKMTGLDATKIKLGATGTTTDGTNVSGRDYRIVAYRH